jgi:hypothetical protein
MGFQWFKEWLGILVVKDVMFSYRSFFSREILGKIWGLSTSCGASMSPWVEWDIVSSFSKILLKQQFASSQEGFLFDHYILFTITFIVL